mmetsp:Transcript_13701/g.57603  ORF Transcript_13701/g.57603 Transcript_13701/m.57603 type:complete len:201 (+) Transcript_13701:1225-1827(+)
MRSSVAQSRLPRTFVPAFALGRRRELVPRRVWGRHPSAPFLDPLELLSEQRTAPPVDLPGGHHLGEVILRPLLHAPHLFLHELIHAGAPPLRQDVRVRERVVALLVLPPPERSRDFRPVQHHGRRHRALRSGGSADSGGVSKIRRARKARASGGDDSHGPFSTTPKTETSQRARPLLLRRGLPHSSETQQQALAVVVPPL